MTTNQNVEAEKKADSLRPMLEDALADISAHVRGAQVQLVAESGNDFLVFARGDAAKRLQELLKDEPQTATPG